MDTPQVTSLSVGAAPFIAAACRELQIARSINAILKWDEKQVKVSPGTAITALLVNILTDRQPLYRVAEFYEHQDVALLFAEDITSEDLHDDTLGRSLDRLFLADPKQVFQTVACGAVSRGHVKLGFVHADTTSLSLYGDFDPSNVDQELATEGGRPLLDITFGHSKQQRPDLKQFIYGLLVSAEGVPVMGTTNDGNTSDKTWNQQVITEMQSSFIDPKQVIYVADSALITPDNLDQLAIAKMRFVSRLPENYNLAAQLKAQAWEADKWIHLGNLREGKNAATYATKSIQAELCGRQYRFIVVRSSALDKRKTKSIDKQLANERIELEKQALLLGKQIFYCRPDAQQALTLFMKEHRSALATFKGAIEERQVVQRPPGRPKKDVTYPTETQFFVQISVGDPDAKVVKELYERESTFVLITSLDEVIWSDAEVLHEYKEQAAVELSFRFLKHPLLIGGIYVQSPRRAEALAYVFLLALLVAAYIQMKIRRVLKEKKETVELEGKRITDKPTIRAILDLLNHIQVVQVETDQGVVRIMPRNVDKRALRMIELAGYDVSIYTKKVS